MSKEKDAVSPSAPPTEATDMPVTVHTQYIRDLSFENPQAPMSLQAGLAMPIMDVNIGMDARKLDDQQDIKNLYEVALTISAEAKRDDKTVFIAEVIYGSTVSIGAEVPEDQHHPILLIEIPRIAFPFARQILATMVSQGGYPPLLVSPIDFHSLYLERFKDDLLKSEAEGESKSKSKIIN